MNRLGMAFVLVGGFSAWASDFSQEMDDKFGSFVTIERELLERAIAKIPEQSTTWGCGLHQVGHAMVCAGIPCNVDFTQPGDYPLAVDINTKKGKVGKALSMPMIAGFAQQMNCDAEGNFRVGATPHDMAQFLGACLNDCSVKPCATSLAHIEQEDFMAVVQKSIEKNMPALAYYVVDASRKLIHVYSIVGYDDIENQLLLLDTIGSGINRLKVMDTSKFISEMDASSIVGLVSMIDSLGAFIGLRGMIEADGGKVANPASVQAWKGYSMIGFVGSEEVQDKPAPEQSEQKLECSIQ